ncbi:IclR family transcriptional regulator [Paracidovorax valerianellae]|uniref:Transcriptional regulator, IclR family n=1 Tax=Paracidovorax valerianellae TaxID=187868 RepID=A0A1G6V0P8_9BURK|nr:IclR family transcriptional regulator [Paracidovorax valerianellae]MDA8447516.1 IclR family transcriptional regulator [Paracidovorax valerianellae]SDD46557.1 transcriptional regulator, IclR family [Paracidovorax valerianellae]
MQDDMEDAIARGRRGIQSVEVGGQLLQALVHEGTPMALKDLARDAGMSPAKAHPYLVSFGRLGLVEQDEASGRYALGPLALQLGLISLQQSSPVTLATPLLAPLAREIGQTVAIAVWGDRGPTIVRVEESPETVFVSMRHGTVFSLAGTASGRLFGAYLDLEVARASLEAERSLMAERPPATTPGTPPRDPLPAWEQFERQLAEVREHGISRSEGEVVRGVNAMSAPVFGPDGELVLAITAIGAMGTFDASWDGPVARALKACTAGVSQRLGAQGR